MSICSCNNVFREKIDEIITQPTIYRVIGYFWMSNAYFAVATDSQFDLVFETRDEATVKTIDSSTFSTNAPSHAFCQRCKQHRLKALDE